MAKHKFTANQRKAIWEAHNKRCVYCHKPILDWGSLQIDHIIPESDNQPQKLEKIRKEYALGSDFEINSYENWLPSHSGCNRQKGNWLYQANNAYHYIEIARKYAPKVKKIEQKLQKQLERSIIISKAEAGLQKRIITEADLINLTIKAIHQRLPVYLIEQIKSVGKDIKVRSIHIFEKIKTYPNNSSQYNVILAISLAIGGCSFALLIEGIINSNFTNTGMAISIMVTYMTAYYTGKYDEQYWKYSGS